MKRNFFIVYLLLLITFSGCKYGGSKIQPSLTFNTNELIVTIGETSDLPIDIIGYDINDLEFVIENPEIINLNFIRIEPLQVGITNINVIVKSKPSINTSIKVIVYGNLIAKPTISTSIPIMQVDQKAKLLFINQSYVRAPIECFDWENSDNSVATMDDELNVVALREGVTTFTATLRSDPTITGSFELAVVSSPPIRENGKVALLLKTENDVSTINAGDELKIIIDDDSIDLDDYYWRVINTKIARVNEEGRLMGSLQGIAEVYVHSKEDKKIYGKVCIEVVGTPNVDYVEKLVLAAENELGYREHQDGYTKYGYWYGIYYGSYFTNLDWCAMFVSWCANEAGTSTVLIPPFANVSNGKDTYRQNNIYQLREDYIPKPGDIIFFLRNGAGHTGIVTGCDGINVYTIEGNTSNMVARRSYPLNYRTIDGYGTPNYQDYIKA